MVIPKEFLGAFKAGHRAWVRELIDEELARKLLKKIVDEDCQESRTHLAFITKFNNEYYKGVVKKGDGSAFHGSDESRKECYARNYRQRMDAFSCTLIELSENTSTF